MARPQQTVRNTLVEQGFRPVYETAAVTLLEHPEHPGYLIRLGVTRIVAERDGREIYRDALLDFSVRHLLEVISTAE